ncbi:glycosyltransferase [Bacteroidales bacterium OttesenSCG-928-C19]|nr:glycosyltransferase [Bacteroidales bacterium OttesenSCG-928-C19]
MNRKKDKICFINNYSPHYRKEIFMLMERELSCDFYFGDKMGDVKKIDFSLLKNFKKEVQNIIICKPIYYQKGVIFLLFKGYSKFILYGEHVCVSSWIFLFLAKIFRKEVYLWTHGYYGKESKFRLFFERIFYSMPKGVMLYGNYAKNLMRKDGLNEKKLHVIYNSLAYDKQIKIRNNITSTDIFQNHFENNYHNLIFVGRLTKVKQLDMLLKALCELNKHTKQYNLTLIGKGEMENDLLLLAKELNIEKNIWFYGASYDEQVLSKLIYNADLCISPGNVGLTAIHAMTYGCPVITHDNFAWQMPEFEAIKKGKTGDFFKYNNLDSLIETIQNWFQLNLEREKVCQNCYEEIDSKWNPYYQLGVMKKVMGL